MFQETLVAIILLILYLFDPIDIMVTSEAYAMIRCHDSLNQTAFEPFSSNFLKFKPR